MGMHASISPHITDLIAAWCSHGTYCAGIAISDPYGVAKAAHAIAVKVLSDSGSGSLSDMCAPLPRGMVTFELMFTSLIAFLE
ncbi:hypothetical protein BDM02DRAFT_389582 [Thelephora ganbajun]|uniref:Uncharacterized protein n=1 Tax=Thelephora ganbajun TaxID=370292 RepID=A0ACB6Z8M3_THEGA|nr:hypothetical protein BDM02DRAFT_389582 [Thelephora ganbajun]